MQLETTWVELPAGEATTQGYFVRPAAAKGALPGILVIQEVWGVDGHIQDVCQRFATAGYAVLAPDLFATGGKPEELAPERIEEAKTFLDVLPRPAWFDPAQRAPVIATQPEPLRSRLTATLGLLLTRERPFERYLKALEAGYAHLARGPSQGRAVAVAGFCLGGTLAQRLAAREPKLAACVSFYGATAPADEVARIRVPVFAQYAEHDPNVNATVPALEGGLKAQGTPFTHHVYAGAGHAFFNDSRRSFHVDAARLAWARTLAYLAEKLG